MRRVTPAARAATASCCSTAARRHQGQLMDVKIERTGSFTLYGDPAVVNL